jgi:recombination protein U
MVNQSNKGRYFEEWLELTNQIYESRGQAIINKIPTPWVVQRKFKPYNKTYEIASAFPGKKSTVDFGGTAQNKSIWFDVKTTIHKTMFPFANISKHQIEYLQKVHAQGGKAFILIYSSVHDKTWLLWIDKMIEYMELGERKSFTFNWLDSNCKIIKSKNGIPIDYLPEVLNHQSEG